MPTEMTKPEIEARINDVKNLIRIWHRFYRTLQAGFEPETLTPEREKEFQEIKTTVAEKHKAFMSVIERDQHIGQSILNMIKRVISLKEFGQLSAIEVNKVSIEWHDANILLHETLGSLEYKLEEVQSVTAQESFQKKWKSGGAETAKTLLKIVKWLVILGVLAGGIFALWWFWEPISSWGPIKAILEWGPIKSAIDWIKGFFS